MNTLEEIRARKEELHAEIQKKEEVIASTWESLWQPTKANTKGEMVTHIIANSITACLGDERRYLYSRTNRNVGR